jgi:hypothetical protein
LPRQSSAPCWRRSAMRRSRMSLAITRPSPRIAAARAVVFPQARRRHRARGARAIAGKQRHQLRRFVLHDEQPGVGIGTAQRVTLVDDEGRGANWPRWVTTSCDDSCCCSSDTLTAELLARSVSGARGC